MSRKRIFNIFIICVVCFSVLLMCGFASIDAFLRSPEADNVAVYLNGIKVTDAIRYGDTTYTPLRAFSEALDLETNFAWDEETETVTVEAEGLELSATVGQKYFTANGRCFYAPDGVLNLYGSIVVPMDELAQVFGAELSWDEATESLSLGLDNLEMLESGDDFYNEDDLYWLSRLIDSESGNQPMDGKLAVGNVVMNRVALPSCPDSIYGVIFDTKYGVQFSVIENRTIYNEPRDESVIAAKLCLEGYNIVPDAVYFVNPSIGVSSWFTRTREFIDSIGEHDFYA